MSKMLPANALLARSPDAIGTEISAHTVLLHSVRWTYLELNFVGQAIWRLLETPRELSSIIAQLIADFRVDEPTCRHDVLVFLNELSAKEYISVIDSP